MRTHLMASTNEQHPSTRAFLLGFNPAAADHDPAKFHGSILVYEYMPRATFRATSFAEVDGKWEPMGHMGEDANGTVNPALARRYMEDLRAFAQDPRTRARFETSLHAWRELFGMAQASDVSVLTGRLHSLVASQEPKNIAMVRDFIETIERHYPGMAHVIQKDQLGLKPVVTVKNRSNKADVIAVYPQWAKILKNPATEIAKLVAQQNSHDLHTLAAILDVVVDEEVTQIAIQNLSQDFSRNKHFQSQVMSVLDALIAKGDVSILDDLVNYTFSQPYSAILGKQLSVLIQKLPKYSAAEEEGNEDVLHMIKHHLYSRVFNQPHSAGWGTQLSAFIEKLEDGNNIKEIAIVEEIFSQPHSVGWGAQFSVLIEKFKDEDINVCLAIRAIFGQPYSAGWGTQFSAMIEKLSTSTRTAQYGLPWDLGWSSTVRFVFSQPHSAGWGTQLSALIERASVKTLTTLEWSFFGALHAVGWEPQLDVLRARVLQAGVDVSTFRPLRFQPVGAASATSEGALEGISLLPESP
jgi:hypothetical protein